MSEATLGRTRARGFLIATALAVASVVVPFSAESAQASAIPCPTGTMSSPAISSWQTDYADHGVTLCTGLLGAGNVVVKVQIVDLTAGAYLELRSDPAATAANPADNTFTRNSIGDWANTYNVQDNPSQSVYFSVTNAGFFTSTSTPTTKLSLPEKRGSIRSTGYAIYGTDPASDIPKRKLQFDWSYPQQLRVGTFPTYYYTETEVEDALDGYEDGLVGFDPAEDPTGSSAATAYRTFVGSDADLNDNASTAYILTTGQAMTVAQATAVLKFFGSESEIQLDGGGSTNMASYAGNMQPTFGNRAIPEVILVAYGP